MSEAANRIQLAIQKAVEGAATDLNAITSKAFEQHQGSWKPRRGCLCAYYSSGERILCGILLAAYFAYHGIPSNVTRPMGRDVAHPSDHVWPGGWYIATAPGFLTHEKAWEAIRVLLP